MYIETSNLEKRKTDDLITIYLHRTEEIWNLTRVHLIKISVYLTHVEYLSEYADNLNELVEVVDGK